MTGMWLCYRFMCQRSAVWLHCSRTFKWRRMLLAVLFGGKFVDNKTEDYNVHLSSTVEVKVRLMHSLRWIVICSHRSQPDINRELRVHLDNITGLSHRDKQPFMLTFTPVSNFRVTNSPNLHVFGLWEEAEVPRVEPVQAWEEHANSTQRGPNPRPGLLNPGPSCW